MGSISTREWIRWQSDRTSSEPTSTLVLTSPGKRFVDIRILNQVPPTRAPVVQAKGIQPLTQLDWAFVGFSSSQLVKDEKGFPVVQSTWKHFADSGFPDADEAADSGLMYPRPDGTTLEKGSMMNPITSKTETYEELWRDGALEPTRKGGKVECAVLQLQDDKQRVRGMVVRLGQYCQGFMRAGEQIALERWKFAEKDGWQREARMGDLWLPCGVATEFRRLEMGGKVKYGDDEWFVVELSES